MSYHRVTDNIHVAINEYGSNIACLTLKDELVFIDAGLLPKYTGKFRNTMEKKYDLKASTLIITHAHIDHIFAMNIFNDCEVIAAEQAKTRFDRFLGMTFDDERVSMMERVFTYIREAARDGEMRLPDKWVKGEEEVRAGLVIRVEGGHSACSSSTYGVDDRVLFAGDLLQAERYPYFGEPDTDLSAWNGALSRWMDMGLDWVVPGHGSVVESVYLAPVRGFFMDMVDAVKKLKALGISEEDIALHPELPSGYWSSSAERYPAYDNSIRRLYRSH